MIVKIIGYLLYAGIPSAAWLLGYTDAAFAFVCLSSADWMVNK